MGISISDFNSREIDGSSLNMAFFFGQLESRFAFLYLWVSLRSQLPIRVDQQRQSQMRQFLAIFR